MEVGDRASAGLCGTAQVDVVPIVQVVDTFLPCAAQVVGRGILSKAHRRFLKKLGHGEETVIFGEGWHFETGRPQALSKRVFLESTLGCGAAAHSNIYLAPRVAVLSRVHRRACGHRHRGDSQAR